MRKLTVLTLSAAVLGTTLLAPGVANAANDGHFIMFSNRSGYAPRVCIKNYSTGDDGSGGTITTQGSPECKTIFARRSYVFRISTAGASAGIRLTTNDGAGHIYKDDYNPLDRDVCLRETTSGAIHEATDKPCTDD
jgi:hypothetical protein